MSSENLITEVQSAFAKEIWVNRTDEFFANQFGEVEVKRINSKTPTSLFLNPIKLLEEREYVFQFSCDVWIENFFALTRSDAFLMVVVLPDDRIVQNGKQKMLGTRVEKQAFISANMENLTSGKWKHVELNIKTKGRFFDVVLHLSGDGWLKYKNLTLIQTLASEEINDYIIL